ncbi:MAG: esterase-like activity of phytase family protein [Deltaproteobacteria bacterium]|nr:esterase-like activity of phytase family protein [Deltaproteobacteria bacterium]
MKKFLSPLFVLISIGFLLSCGSDKTGVAPSAEENSDSGDESSGDDSGADSGDDPADDDSAPPSESPDSSGDSADDGSSDTSDTTGTSDPSDTSDSSDSSDSSGSTDPTPSTCDSDFDLMATSSDIGSNLSAGYEPSGAVWHSRLSKLFVVDDDGVVSSLDADGNNITNWSYSADLEGITVADPDSDFVYLGIENPDGIAEFDITTGAVTRTFNLTTWMTGAANSGLEALTFVPDSSSSEGGTFYAGHQGEGKIYVFELPIASSSTSTTVSFVTSFTPISGQTDISGLDYDETNDVLYAIYDAYNDLVAMETDGTILDSWTLPGNDQEGIALNPDECVWFIAEDEPTTQDVWRYSL